MPNTSSMVEFDRALLTPEYLSDPYRFYAELREKAPVYFSQRMNAWVLTRYRDVAAGLSDRRLICGRRVESYAAGLPRPVREEMRPLFQHLEKWALRRNLAERAIDGVFSDRGFSLDWAV